MPWNFPIFLTWMRVLLIPVFTALFFLPKGVFDNHTINWLAAAIFAIAAITDWFDGFLARRWKQTSDFGAFLDPVADKLMVAVALILLVSLGRTYDKKVKMNTLVSDNLTLIELPSKSTVNIYSVDGKLVSSNRVNSGESINVSKLQKGNYIVTVEDGTNKVSRKIVKK